MDSQTDTHSTQPIDDTAQPARGAGQFQDARADRERGERKSRPASFEVTLRRFFRDTQQSRILSITKQKRYKAKKISRRLRRHSAVRKAAIQKIKRGW